MLWTFLDVVLKEMTSQYQENNQDFPIMTSQYKVCWLNLKAVFFPFCLSFLTHTRWQVNIIFNFNTSNFANYISNIINFDDLCIFLSFYCIYSWNFIYYLPLIDFKLFYPYNFTLIFYFLLLHFNLFLNLYPHFIYFYITLPYLTLYLPLLLPFTFLPLPL